MKISPPLTATQPATRGRPRGFDRAAALATALRLFWRHGYEATSIADLSAAMGIAPASLYAAFGDKEALFREVLTLYVTGPAAYAMPALQRPTLAGALTALVDDAAAAFSQADWPHGCLATLGDAGLGPRSGQIGSLMAARRTMFRDLIRDRIAAAQDQGEVASGIDAEQNANAVLMILFGIAVAAKDGMATEDLQGAGRLALSGVCAALGLRVT